MATKIDLTISRSIIDASTRQVALAKLSCTIANKAMVSASKIGNTLKNKLKPTGDVKHDSNVHVLKLTNDKIATAATQAVWRYAAIVEQCNLLEKTEDDSERQVAFYKIIKDAKTVSMCQQIATDALHTYITIASSL